MHCDVGVMLCNRTIHEEPETIRGMYALTDTRNCTHGSGRWSYFEHFTAVLAHVLHSC